MYLLTLCLQLTDFIQGFDLMLHSKNTSTPSRNDELTFEPSSNVTTGMSEKTQEQNQMMMMIGIRLQE